MPAWNRNRPTVIATAVVQKALAILTAIVLDGAHSYRL